MSVLSRHRRIGSALLAVAAVLAVLAGLAVVVVVLPSLVVERDLDGARITAAERLGAVNNVRTTLVQAVAGAVVLFGAYATWRQLRVNQDGLNATREGHITDRFSRAVDQQGVDPPPEPLRRSRPARLPHGQGRPQRRRLLRCRPAGGESAQGASRGTKFTGADLRLADLRGTDLTGADLTRAKSEGALASDVTTWPADFDIQAAGVVVVEDPRAEPSILLRAAALVRNVPPLRST